jgi:alpha-ketoglutarate-dependent taurine dioxygenase
MTTKMTPSSYGLDQVNISFLESGNADSPTKTTTTTTTLPLIVSPRWDDSLEFLVQFLEQNRSWAEEQILNHGVLLLRGFSIHTPVDFETAVLSLQPHLCDTYRGTSPRTQAPGTQYAFSAADVPVHYPIAQHLEMSFLPAPPRQLYFGCLQASTCVGGETSLCDFRKVYHGISPALRHKLQTKQIKYTRTHFKVGETYTYDVGAMLGWPALFGTDDPRKVEELCAKEGAPPVQWVGPNHDTFLQEWIDAPFQQHPIHTHETVWFNHSQVFHWTTFPAELWFSYCRFKDISLLIHCILITLFSCIKYGLLGYTMNLNTTFGDGTNISIWEMAEIRNAIHKNMVFSRWQKGDILCIDNFSTSHGRQPTYDKGRKVIVAWSMPHNKTLADVPLLPSSSSPPPPLVVVAEATVVSHPIASSAAVFLPDLEPVSPENTITSLEAETFQARIHSSSSSRSSKSTNETLTTSPVIILESQSPFWKATKSE